MTEVYKAGKDTEHFEGVLTSLFKKVLECIQEPYKFEPFHEAMREPFDYYGLGTEFVSGVVNYDDSLVMGESRIDNIQKQVAAGENVVLLANHQSEADPQVFSCLLDERRPGFAESTIFVAGDRVTTDLFAQPFSMGRNLLCIYSKKHIENPPELKAEKSKHNKNVMRTMSRMFKDGGKIIWVAPSGGRDRKDSSGQYQVADFDPKTIEMFRLMAAKAKRTTHFYPLSMLTYPIAPPPDAIGGSVGEERVVRYSAAGLNFGDEIDLDAFSEACLVDNFPEGCDKTQKRDEVRDALTAHIHGIVAENYQGLETGLEGKL
jgi:glycerol-3-phosphate O-acyltransferase